CRRPRSPRLRTGRAPRCEWPWAFRWWPRREWPSLEVALLLAVLHGGLGDAVIGARLAAISATTSGSVFASDATAPVQLMSPTVRNRTHFLKGSSPGSSSTKSDTA